jgi:hypothetical protein
MAGTRKVKPKWGSEPQDDPPGLVAPIASTEGWDFARDPEAEEKARPVSSLAIRAPTSPLGRLLICEYGAGAAGCLAFLSSESWKGPSASTTRRTAMQTSQPSGRKPSWRVLGA